MDKNKYHIEKYYKKYYDEWNDFVAKAKNATFLFHRDFMEYHQDRFEDFSLLLFKKKKLVALFPAHKIGEKLYSHQGLSYGGMILHTNCNFKEHYEFYYHLMKYLYHQHIKELYLKEIPLIYHQSSSEESALLFFWLQARLVELHVYSYLELSSHPKPNRNRQRAIKKATEKSIKIQESSDYDTFWKMILIPNLKQRFGVAPTHTAEEIKNLCTLFPDTIKLYAAYENYEMKAGAVLFITHSVVHFQYSSGLEDRKENGALDLLFYDIIKQYSHKKYVAFGSSSNRETGTINEGLLYWKESYGASNIVQRFYELNTENYNYLEGKFI